MMPQFLIQILHNVCGTLSRVGQGMACFNSAPAKLELCFPPIFLTGAISAPGM